MDRIISTSIILLDQNFNANYVDHGLNYLVLLSVANFYLIEFQLFDILKCSS